MGGQKREWRNGKAMAFDTHYFHETGKRKRRRKTSRERSGFVGLCMWVWMGARLCRRLSRVACRSVGRERSELAGRRCAFTITTYMCTHILNATRERERQGPLRPPHPLLAPRRHAQGPFHVLLLVVVVVVGGMHVSDGDTPFFLPKSTTNPTGARSHQSPFPPSAIQLSSIQSH